MLDKHNNMYSPQVSKEFGSKVFDMKKMRDYLSKKEFIRLDGMIGRKMSLDESLTTSVAKAMKDWGIQNGATHFSHWFQPLSGVTAEKHDSFFDIENSRPIHEMGGESLIQQEPDASSFPSGGLRNTFEARGYSSWDPTSPAFIYKRILYIPSIFISFNGESLDYKTPLLKSLNVLKKSSKDVSQIFENNSDNFKSLLGWEQEYFLIDKNVLDSRIDIKITGRTLLGAAQPKGQAMCYNYFGVIPNKVKDFMCDVAKECFLLGIPIKTRHNEVAPNQYEFAHIHEEMNIAIDHNTLFMNILIDVAEKHNLTVLFHEKPFEGVNGSGKHCNWSLESNGKNLFTPKDTEIENLEFLTFFVNTLSAINKYGELLCASTAMASNDLRLGGHEAPPSIMSVFIGENMLRILKAMCGLESEGIKEKSLKQILSILPEIKIDTCDRNRTSPFAYNINKFEFRMVGSSANCARPMTVLNTIIAKQLKNFMLEYNENMVAINEDPNTLNKDVLIKILKAYLLNSERIIFNGDGYSKEWIITAKELGIPKIENAVEAFDVTVKRENIDLFTEMEVLTPSEIFSRHHYQLEQYCNIIKVEAETLIDIIKTNIIPSIISYQTDIIKNYKGLQNLQVIFSDESVDNLELKVEANDKCSNFFNSESSIGYEKRNMIITLENHIKFLSNKCKMVENNITENNSKELGKRAQNFEMLLRKECMELRICCDEVEKIMDERKWRLMKYRDIFGK
ncbi:Glutamate-ammonia ligase [Spraguea lophii 42_110]|uniref:Glutamate-ammonia ligase n=1 Tax=Spraguea lophii (strain 42_110) TaxID=1358809 RepID=S7WA76_SPRLO|nr:Glutamate-ammonia ligase [Spraguea lophii 42_110]